MSGMHQSANARSILGLYGIDPVLHVIDFEDVALSPEGLRMVHHGARAVMRQFMPGGDFKKLTRGQAVALFVDQVFWEEHSGGLIMCADLAGRSICLPIPSRFWTVRGASDVVQ